MWLVLIIRYENLRNLTGFFYSLLKGARYPSYRYMFHIALSFYLYINYSQKCNNIAFLSLKLYVRDSFKTLWKRLKSDFQRSFLSMGRPCLWYLCIIKHLMVKRKKDIIQGVMDTDTVFAY